MRQPAADTQRPSLGLELLTAERRGGYDVPRWADVLAMARLAEEIGFEAVWVQDHLLVPEAGGEPHGVWDCWSVLAALAATTQRMRIGAFVACTGFRNPALIAKMAETVDEISGGRFVLGLGAGWVEAEFRAFGFPYDRRAARFSEALTIICGLLRTGAVDYAGAFSSARECLLRPRGPRPRGVPIMVGAVGERMLRLCAQYADIWHGAGPNVAVVRRELARVDAACAAVGRDPATLERNVSVLVDFTGGQGIPASINPARLPAVSGEPGYIAEELQRIFAEGISHIQLTPFPATLAGVASLAPVLQAFHPA